MVGQENCDRQFEDHKAAIALAEVIRLLWVGQRQSRSGFSARDDRDGVDAPTSLQPDANMSRIPHWMPCCSSSERGSDAYLAAGLACWETAPADDVKLQLCVGVGSGPGYIPALNDASTQHGPLSALNFRSAALAAHGRKNAAQFYRGGTIARASLFSSAHAVGDYAIMQTSWRTRP